MLTKNKFKNFGLFYDRMTVFKNIYFKSNMEGIKNYFKTNLKTVLIVLGITAVLYLLLVMGVLPVYSSSPLEHKFSYFFPLWVILALLFIAHLDASKQVLHEPETPAPEEEQVKPEQAVEEEKTKEE